MELRQIKYFVALFEEGSVTRAARRTHVVQPAISMQLSKLEDELGHRLFDRTSQGMVPTAAGRQAYARLMPLLREYTSAREELIGFGGRVAGQISVGVIGSLRTYGLSECLESFCNKYPDVSITVTGGYTVDFLEMLDIGKIDVAVINQANGRPNLGALHILQEDLALVASPENSFRSDGAVALADIAKLKIVLPTIRHGIRTVIDDAANRIGIKLEPKIELDEMKLIEDFVRKTDYLAIMPPISIQRALKTGQLRQFPIEPRIRREIMCVHNRKRKLSEPARLFIAEFKERIDTITRIPQVTGRFYPADD
ncbi:LysR family transcriptional regulator [Sedimentitalea sp. XS_ASV28]|uniref:LysR family transcriptional regulator n=1 Tax=Sedimentitalea sp. XS_ASV28 TaxID=3241296 RepID=UPI003511ADF8